MIAIISVVGVLTVLSFTLRPEYGPGPVSPLFKGRLGNVSESVYVPPTGPPVQIEGVEVRLTSFQIKTVLIQNGWREDIPDRYFYKNNTNCVAMVLPSEFESGTCSVLVEQPFSGLRLARWWLTRLAQKAAWTAPHMDGKASLASHIFIDRGTRHGMQGKGDLEL